MDLRRASLVLYILFVFHLQQNILSVSSRPSSVDTNHETLPYNASKLDVVGFEGKFQELAVVIKRGLRGGGGGRGGGGRSSRGGGSGGSWSSSGGGGGSLSRPRGGARVVPVHTGGGSHHSSGSRKLRGTVCTISWLALSVGLLLAH